MEMFKSSWKSKLVYILVFLTMPLWFPIIFLTAAYVFVYGIIAVGFISIATLNVIVWLVSLLGVK